MAHELDRNERNGKSAMFSVRQTPWHREGVILNQAPTFDEALVLAGVDFEVGLKPLFVTDGADGYVKSPTCKAIYRMDRDEKLGDAILSVVTDKYAPLQNRDAFGTLLPLLDKGVAHLETGGSLRNGGDTWMLVRFDIDDPVVREVFAAETVPFGLITNNHTGRASCEIMETPIRVVCANTLAAALGSGKQVKVAHRGDARVRLVDEAEKLWGGIIERYQVIAESYRVMKATILEVDEFVQAVLDNAAPLPKLAFTPEGEHLTSRGYDAAFAAAEKRRTAITEKWEGGVGHVGDHSAWEAYNAAVEVIDHDVTLFRTRGSRVASLLGGRLAERKTLVLNAVNELCQVGS